MNISNNGIKLIQHYESCSLKSYRDSVGVLTIGWGHTGPDVYDGMVISQDEADQLFLDDIKSFENMLNDRLSVVLEQNQFDALLSFLFNVGPGKAGTKDGLFTLRDGNPSTLWKLVQSGQNDGVPQQFMLWTRAGGQVLRGLVARRRTESNLYSTGILEFFN